LHITTIEGIATRKRKFEVQKEDGSASLKKFVGSLHKEKQLSIKGGNYWPCPVKIGWANRKVPEASGKRPKDWRFLGGPKY